jgi:2-oxoglutarate dehydrogenase E2 component (dihydrolipoamide succinyltransferase)
MPADIVVPDLGESITEGVIASWLRADGDSVAVDEPLLELETDKATVELPSPAAGVLRIAKQAGETVAVGDRLGTIEEESERARPSSSRGGADTRTAEAGSSPAAEAQAEPDAEQPDQPDGDAPASAQEQPRRQATAAEQPALSPAARRLVEEHELDPQRIEASGKDGRITKSDVLAHLGDAASTRKSQPPRASKPATEPVRAEPAPAAPSPGLALVRREAAAEGSRSGSAEDEERVAMSPIRRTIAARLVGAQQTAAILTTFNEIDMSAVMALRARYKENFKETHGVSLGFMSFFARACVLACGDVASVNARIEGEDIVYSRRVHLGIAASTPKGLVVPVVKNADRMSFAELEKEIGRLAELARSGKLSVGDMTGGTFTISNGGVFGSLLSTPILNPPQSGILGMHKIEKRPVVVDDEIVIRPMMYVALSYDHRLIDGREAVTFLVRVKERIEDPERMLLGV